MSKYGAAEHIPLSTTEDEGGHHVEPMEYKSLSSFGASNADEEDQKKRRKTAIIAGAAVAMAGLIAINASVAKSLNGRLPIGPYELSSVQEGSTFFDNYEFYDGPDSLGSAGYNNYVSKKRATQLNIANITKEDGETFIFMSSSPTEKGPRESVRLEGKTRYDRGLFILDLRHMPAGCGVWPAWWLTDEAAWPDNGEIDIVEGINYQTLAKTALHTSDRCSMFAHVPAWAKTGEWDRASKYMHVLSWPIILRHRIIFPDIYSTINHLYRSKQMLKQLAYLIHSREKWISIHRYLPITAMLWLLINGRIRDVSQLAKMRGPLVSL